MHFIKQSYLHSYVRLPQFPSLGRLYLFFKGQVTSFSHEAFPGPVPHHLALSILHAWHLGTSLFNITLGSLHPAQCPVGLAPTSWAKWVVSFTLVSFTVLGEQWVCLISLYCYILDVQLPSGGIKSITYVLVTELRLSSLSAEQYPASKSRNRCLGWAAMETNVLWSSLWRMTSGLLVIEMNVFSQQCISASNIRKPYF